MVEANARPLARRDHTAGNSDAKTEPLESAQTASVQRVSASANDVYARLSEKRYRFSDRQKTLAASRVLSGARMHLGCLKDNMGCRDNSPGRRIATPVPSGAVPAGAPYPAAMLQACQLYLKIDGAATVQNRASICARASDAESKNVRARQVETVIR